MTIKGETAVGMSRREFLDVSLVDWNWKSHMSVGLYLAEVKELVGLLEKWLVDREGFEMEVE